MTFEEWATSIFKRGTDAEYGIAKAAWNAATLAEREACAKIAETASHKLGGYQFAAEAIRARNK